MSYSYLRGFGAEASFSFSTGDSGSSSGGVINNNDTVACSPHGGAVAMSQGADGYINLQCKDGWKCRGATCGPPAAGSPPPPPPPPGGPKAPPSVAALCAGDGGVRAYIENGYEFTVNCATGKICKGGAEKATVCTPAYTPTKCPVADGTDGPPGMMTSWGSSAFSQANNVKNCLPDAQVNTQIRDICNTSIDPLYCYTANTHFRPLLGRYPTPDAVAAWVRWMDAKRRGIAYCDSTVQVFGPQGDPRCPTAPAKPGSSIAKTGRVFSTFNADRGGGGSGAPSSMPTPGDDVSADKTMLYVGLVLAGLVVIGGAAYWKSQQKKGAAT